MINLNCKSLEHFRCKRCLGNLIWLWPFTSTKALFIHTSIFLKPFTFFWIGEMFESSPIAIKVRSSYGLFLVYKRKCPCRLNAILNCPLLPLNSLPKVNISKWRYYCSYNILDVYELCIIFVFAHLGIFIFAFVQHAHFLTSGYA